MKMLNIEMVTKFDRHRMMVMIKKQAEFCEGRGHLIPPNYCMPDRGIDGLIEMKLKYPTFDIWKYEVPSKI